MKYYLIGLSVALLTLNIYGAISRPIPPLAREGFPGRQFDHRPIKFHTPEEIIAYGRLLPPEKRIEGTMKKISETVIHAESAPVLWRDNYILRVLAYLSQSFEKYEYLDYRRAIRRGYGVCSQQAIVTAGVLGEMGYSSRIVALGGHVVAAADDSEEKIVDTDLSVILPFSLAHAENHQASVTAEYISQGIDADYARALSPVYNHARNQQFSSPQQYRPRMYLIEKAAYFLKWAFPLSLLGLGLTFARRRR